MKKTAVARSRSIFCRLVYGALMLVALITAGCTLGKHDPAPAPGAQTPQTSVNPLPAPKADPPPRSPVKVSIPRNSVNQGDFLVVRAEATAVEPQEVMVSVFGLCRPARKTSAGYVALMPVPVRATPGEHVIEVVAAWPQGKELSEERVEVITREFAVSQITAAPEQTDKITEQKLQQDLAKVSKAKSQSLGEKQWQSGFELPLNAVVTTDFGLTRYVNDKETWRHSGIDYGASRGASIGACADGVVVFAGMLNGTGNTVIVDHGLDLFSSYCHMDDITVKLGDRVIKGQLVGHVGSTGFSTGPHLHWTVTIGTTAIDPNSLIRAGGDLKF